MAHEGGGARVLIADADPGLRRQLYKRLLDAGLFADSVADSQAALEQLHQRSYAVILLDLRLSGAGAERILEFVSSDTRGARPVILVMSDASGGRSLDVDLVQIVLRKPCNIYQLAEMIQSCVRSTTARRRVDPPRRDASEDDAAAMVM